VQRGIALLWPPNHDLIDVGLVATAVDSCGGVRPVAIQPFSTEPEEAAMGDGRFSPDARQAASGALRLRAERMGGGDGRIYLIRAGASDPSGNSGFGCCSVVTPHSMNEAAVTEIQAEAAAAASCRADPRSFVTIGNGAVIVPSSMRNRLDGRRPSGS
jgi:hypothetical protein